MDTSHVSIVFTGMVTNPITDTKIHQNISRFSRQTHVVNLRSKTVPKSSESGLALYTDNYLNKIMSEKDQSCLLHRLNELEWIRTKRVRKQNVPCLSEDVLLFSDKAHADALFPVRAFASIPGMHLLRKHVAYLFGSSPSDDIQATVRRFNPAYRLAGGEKRGYRGDAKQPVVACFCFGPPSILSFQWYHKSKPVDEPSVIELKNGSLCVLNRKASGFDWKRPSVYSLRRIEYLK